MMLRLLSCAFWPFMHLWKMSIKILCPFLNWIICHFGYWVVRFLWGLLDMVLLLKWFANIFSQCVWACCFHFLDGILWSTKFKILIWSIFFFSFCCLWSCRSLCSPCWIEMQTQSFGWSRKEGFYCFARQKGATVGYCPQDCMTHAGGERWEFFSVQGHDQLVDNSWIGCHQVKFQASSVFWSQPV